MVTNPNMAKQMAKKKKKIQEMVAQEIGRLSFTLKYLS